MVHFHIIEILAITIPVQKDCKLFYTKGTVHVHHTVLVSV